MREIWKDIPGYEDRYQVSNLGRVKSLSRYVSCGYKGRGKRLIQETILRPGRFCKGGHVSVVLGKGGNGKPVHQLVLLAFFGKRPKGMDVCHNDGDPTNNRLDNLRYDTRTNNILDVYKTGGSWRKLNLEQVREIKKLLNEGISGVAIAKEYGVTPTCICNIKKGRSYSWVT